MIVFALDEVQPEGRPNQEYVYPPEPPFATAVKDTLWAASTSVGWALGVELKGQSLQ